MSDIARDQAIKGRWWRPERTDDICQGDLLVSEAGKARLNVFGLLFSSEEGIWGPAEMFVVWGTTVTEEPVTLFYCKVREASMAHGGCTCGIAAQLTIVGGHWRSASDLRFSRLSYSTDYLVSWIGSSNIHVNVDYAAGHVKIEALKPESILLSELEGTKLFLQPSVRYSPKIGSAFLADECEIVIVPSAVMAFESLIELVNGMTEILALASGEPVYVRGMHGRWESCGGKMERCEIITYTRRNVDPRTVREREFLFTLNDVRTARENVVEIYFRRRDRFGPVCQLYLGTLYNRALYHEYELLSLAHAAEAFHRLFIGGKYIADSEYDDGVRKALLEAIPDTIESDFRSSLRSKLKYLNEYSLRKRLQDLASRFEPLLAGALGDGRQFADHAAKARNALTHRDVVTSEDVPTAKELFVLCERLGLLLELCLLRELGFDDTLLKRVVENSHRLEAIRLNT